MCIQRVTVCVRVFWRVLSQFVSCWMMMLFTVSGKRERESNVCESYYYNPSLYKYICLCVLMAVVQVSSGKAGVSVTVFPFVFL